MPTARRDWFRKGVAAGVLAGIAVLPAQIAAQTRAAFARFAPVTLSSDQTVRVNVVHIQFHGSDFNAAKSTEATRARACPALLQLYDEAGEVIASSRLRIAPGEARSMDRASPELAIMPGEQRTVYGGIVTRSGACARDMTGSLEIIDTATGRVEVHVSPSRSIGE